MRTDAVNHLTVSFDDASGAEPNAGPIGSTALLPEPAQMGAGRIGDVSAVIAELLLKANANNRRAADTERSVAEHREEQEQNAQLAALTERANTILVSGIATGLTKSASGVLAYQSASAHLASLDASAAKDEISKVSSLQSSSNGYDLGAKLAGAGVDLTKAIGESLEADCDIRAKEHEQAATRASRRLDDAKDKQAATKQLARDVVDFVKQFQQTMASVASASAQRA